jgi:3-oxoacyl-[acyl-carrier protein] reductase
MKVVITGTSGGIGLATAKLFLDHGHDVHGIDLLPAAIHAPRYVHHQADMTVPGALPALDGTEILICNAGVQTGTARDIEVNLRGTMAVAEAYAFQPAIRSVLFNASVSALTGDEFPTYVASKAGVVGYMRSCAIRLANAYHATCNAVCFGGVLTTSNAHVTQDPELWRRIMDVTPLKRWATPEEAAQWCYFMTAVNTFCTGQAIDISGGERNCAPLFVW